MDDCEDLISKNLKRLLILYFTILISTLIWNINQNIFGNPFWPCFILSTTTFLIIYTPFEIYFSFKDIWLDRWSQIHLEDLSFKKVRINTEKEKSKGIATLLITPKSKKILKLKDVIIVLCHGFSDTKETLQFFYLPLALQGFTILAYDSRGTGESKKVGRRSQFLKRIEDFKMIINWIKTNEEYKNKKIYSVGFSVGALTVLCGGFPDKNIEKLVAISSISNYKKILPTFNPILLLRYFFKGIKLFINDNENERLSPYIVINELKQTLPEEDWEKLSSRVLLIHSRNDRIIKLRNFEELSKILNLRDENKLIMKRGGHTNKKNELVLVSALLRFFNAP
ncbi:MAG: alpha/beta hydrolase [Candidatus Heimdallarchaeota archaeon]